MDTMKHVILMVTMVTMLLCGTCYAQNYVAVPGYPGMSVDLDSVKTVDDAYSTITKCKVEQLKDKQVWELTVLINTEQQMVCYPYVTVVNTDTEEITRFNKDPKIRANWRLYDPDSDIPVILNVIKGAK